MFTRSSSGGRHRVLGRVLMVATILLFVFVAILVPRGATPASALVEFCLPQCNSFYDRLVVSNEGEEPSLMVATENQGIEAARLPTVDDFSWEAWQGPDFPVFTLPVDDFSREITLLIHNQFPVTVEVEVSGAYIKPKGATLPRVIGAPLASYTLNPGTFIVLGEEEGDIWGVSHALPMINAGWTDLIVRVVPQVPPTSGGLSIINTRTQ